MLLVGVNHLDDLRGLGSWCSAHVHDPVAGLDVEEQWWDHTDGLLSRDVANLSLGDQELMELCVLLALLQQCTGHVVVPSQVIGVPGQRTRRSSNNAVHRYVAQVGDKRILDRVANLDSVAVVESERELAQNSRYQCDATLRNKNRSGEAKRVTCGCQ